jgi:hypothetical protein
VGAEEWIAASRDKAHTFLLFFFPSSAANTFCSFKSMALHGLSPPTQAGDGYALVTASCTSLNDVVTRSHHTDTEAELPSIGALSCPGACAARLCRLLRDSSAFRGIRAIDDFSPPRQCPPPPKRDQRTSSCVRCTFARRRRQLAPLSWSRRSRPFSGLAVERQPAASSAYRCCCVRHAHSRCCCEGAAEPDRGERCRQHRRGCQL